MKGLIMMKTSEFKQIIEDADLEFDDKSWDVVVRNHEDDVLATIDKKHTGRLKVYYPEYFSLNIYDSIVKYARTTIDERTDKTYTAEFTEQEINVLSDAIKLHVPVIEKRNGIYEATFRFFDASTFDSIIRKIISLTGEVPSNEVDD